MNDLHQPLPFFAAIAMMIIGVFQMQPLKDNALWRRCLSVAVGIAFIVWGIISIGTGHITAWRRNTQTYVAAREPVEFWFVVGIAMTLGILCVYRGVKGRK